MTPRDWIVKTGYPIRAGDVLVFPGMGLVRFIQRGSWGHVAIPLTPEYLVESSWPRGVRENTMHRKGRWALLSIRDEYRHRFDDIVYARTLQKMMERGGGYDMLAILGAALNIPAWFQDHKYICSELYAIPRREAGLPVIERRPNGRTYPQHVYEDDALEVVGTSSHNYLVDGRKPGAKQTVEFLLLDT